MSDFEFGVAYVVIGMLVCLLLNIYPTTTDKSDNTLNAILVGISWGPSLGILLLCLGIALCILPFYGFSWLCREAVDLCKGESSE